MGKFVIWMISKHKTPNILEGGKYRCSRVNVPRRFITGHHLYPNRANLIRGVVLKEKVNISGRL